LDKIIYKLQAQVCKALSNSIRIEIIELLRDGEMGFSEIAEKTGVSKSSLSQHLNIMIEKGGILTQRKEGLSSFYTLSTVKVGQACQLMKEVLIDRLEKQKGLLENFD